MKVILKQIVAERRAYLTIIQPLSERFIRPNDLPKAAATMALLSDEDFAGADWPRLFWPWRPLPDARGTPRANLIRSAALILAAIQRLDTLADDEKKRKGMSERGRRR